jgi:hypothetical protein
VTLYTHAGALPAHQYVLIEPNALGEHGWLKAVWFGLVSYPGRAWGCHVLLECGAVYRSVPLHQLAWREDAEEDWTPSQAQTWDCYGWQFSTIEYPYLAGLDGLVRMQHGDQETGQYLFTAVPVADAYSASPEQAKEFMFMKLDRNGRFAAQPTNHVLLRERSFTDPGQGWPKFLRRQDRVWSAEDEA